MAIQLYNQRDFIASAIESVLLTERILERKMQALSSRRAKNTRTAAPSHWLANEARHSAHMRRFDVKVIPNSLDTNEFRLRDQYVAWEVFGLQQDGPVVLFATDSVDNHRKGFDLLTEALRALPATQPVTLAAVGGMRHGQFLPEGTIALGRIDSSRLLSFAYSAADLFVLPTGADNLPNVALEAIACETPLVGFDVGGVPDVVRTGETGQVV